MPRIAIVANSGSGKSTLASQLTSEMETRLKGPCAYLDLDTIAWQSDAPTELRPHEEAAGDVREFCNNNPHWVVEGRYADLIEVALEAQATLLFLDPGVAVCQDHCRNRPWEPHKYSSKAAQDKNLSFLLDWVADYYQRQGTLSHQAHQSLFDGYSGPKHHLTQADYQHDWRNLITDS